MMKSWKMTLALAVTGALLASAPLSAASDRAAQAVVVAEAAPSTGHAGQGTHDAAGGAAAGHGEAAPGAAHKTHFPPFDSATFLSQLIWLTISFGLLYYLMSRIALPRIGRILEERHDRIADDLEEASKHKAESEAAQASYEKALAEARAKANGIAADTKNRLTADTEANRKALEADLAAKLTSAEARIAGTKTEALTHVRGIAVDATNAIVSTLLGTTPASNDVAKAVDGALAGKDAA